LRERIMGRVVSLCVSFSSSAAAEANRQRETWSNSRTEQGREAITDGDQAGKKQHVVTHLGTRRRSELKDASRQQEEK
jgi:hypothetical protein